ncbi:hypothetical protein DH2020_047641 [Rehmannia glutinosa]|uniref:Uncharacterized protein n=1 Tax=Rehmannia glutinosa TaxID=99300 RepID=A0ABR0U8K7_REHGL
MQRSRLGSSSAAPDEVEDGMVDGSFIHQNGMLLVWKVSRLLIQLHGRSSKKSKELIYVEEEMRKGELEADKDKMMREYRAQLDAERAHKLAHGRNHSSSKSSRKKDDLRILVQVRHQKHPAVMTMRESQKIKVEVETKEERKKASFKIEALRQRKERG